MARFLTLLIIFLHLAIASRSQNRYSIRTYSTDNGLPSNGIKGLQWDDSTSFLWIATEAGISRFNGLDFKNFTKENTPRLSSERMLFIVRNNDGEILTADQYANTFIIRKNYVSFYRHFQPKEDSGKNMFLLSTSKNFLHQSYYRKNHKEYFLRFTSLLNLSDTSCYLVHNEILNYYSVSTEKEVPLPGDKKVSTLFKIDNTVFLEDKSKNLFRFNIETETLQSVKVRDENNQVFDPARLSYSVIWENGMQKPIMFSGTKAWLLKLEGPDIRLQLISDNVPTNSFIRFAQYSDKQKTLFIGTDSKGIIVIAENRVAPQKRETGNRFERNAYYGQVELSNGNILTNEGHIIGNNNNPLKSNSLKGPFILSVYRTNDSLLWYGTTTNEPGINRLNCYNEKSGSLKTYENIILKGLNALTFADNKIYLIDGSGLAFIEGDSLHYIFEKKDWQFISYSMLEVTPGVLFIATCNRLLSYNIKTNKLETLFSKPDCCVRSLWKVKDYVFFGTYGSGFFVWKNGEVKQMPLDKNKYLLYTHCFIPDDQGYCWISTNRGLFKARIEELLNAYDHPSEQVYYHYFGKNDGMDITEMNGGCMPCALRLKNGTLSFPTMDGLLWVQPANSAPYLPSGEIYVDEFLANTRSITPDSISMKELSPKTSEVVLKLGYSAWCNKENIYIDYHLNGYEGWKPLPMDNQSTLRFNNLPSGTYHLQLRKLNGFGINNYTYKEITFTIATPWYKQVWFAFVAAAAFLGIIWLVFQIRLRQHRKNQRKLELQVAEKTSQLLEKTEGLEKADRIKTRLISIISHDIITPLKFLGAAGKNLLEKRKQMPEELQQETIQEITNTSVELQQLSTNILNWIKYQNENRRLVKEEFNLNELVDSVFSLLRSMATHKELVLVNNVPNNLLINQYYEPLKILVYNLVTNAINFSDKGSITVSLDKSGQKNILWVHDEGVGMTDEQIKNILSKEFIISSTNVDNRKGNGLGYLIIKDLVKMMGATLDIQSQKGKGTKVSVFV